MACVRRRRGKYVVDWRDATGRRRWETFAKRKDADARRTEVDQQTRQGIMVDDRLTMDTLIENYRRDHIRTSVRGSTASDYEGTLTLHLEPYWKGWRVRDVQRQDVLDFRAHLIERGLGVPTVNKALRMLGALYRFAMLNGQAHRDPTVKTRLAPAEDADDEGRAISAAPLTVEQQRKLLEHAEPRYRPVIMTALATGLRQGELLGLKWSDVDFDGAVLHVRRQYSRGRLGPPKTKHARRTVPLPPALVSELRRWKLRCPKGEHDLCFPTSAGTPQDGGNLLNRGLYPALRRAGLPRVRFHDLRHCYVSLLIESGVTNVKRIQALVGHASAVMTLDVYGRLLEAADASVGEAVNVALFGQRGSKTVASQSPSGEKLSRVK